MNWIAWVILVLILATCGSDNGRNGGDGSTHPSRTIPLEILDPWKEIGRGFLPESDEVTEKLRALKFQDGMVILYDGSDASGEEWVCRRENRESVFYEVCISLEDDPYFMGADDNTLIWHSLMLNRFATKPECRSWRKGDAKVEMDCMAEIFPAMGGDGFYCAAGLFNGDRALKCSDDWAVLVNGKDDDSKTVCRVLMSDGSGHCLGAPKEGLEDELLILKMQQSTWDGYRSVQDNSLQFIEGEMSLPLSPQNLPEGARLSYSSDNESVCKVGSNDSDGGLGTVFIASSINDSVVCRISLKIEAEGFTDRILFVELPVLKVNDVEWDYYRRPKNYFYPGEILEAEVPASNNSVLTGNEYMSLDDSVCTVNEENGEVTAVASGECTIRLIARAKGYLDVIVEQTIPVDELTDFFASIRWSDFDDLDAGVVLVGTESVLGAPQVMDGKGSPVGSVSIGHISGDCSYTHDGVNHSIYFEDATECVIGVSASGEERGSDKVTREFRFIPGVGEFALTWLGYVNGNTVQYGSPALAPKKPVTSLDSGRVGFSYVATGGGCDVDAVTGVLTILGADISDTLSCVVTLSATHSGYANVNADVTVSILKKSQTLTVPSNPYGSVSSLGSGDSIKIINPPADGMGSVVYAHSSGVCSVEPDGTVTAEATSGNCVVKAHWTGDENHEASTEMEIATIVMVAESGSAPTWSSDPYGNNPTVGGKAVALLDGAINNSTVEYKSGTPEVCSVDPDGSVSGIAVGSCTIQARSVGNDYHGVSAWIDSPIVTVEKGTHPVPVNDSSYYGAGANVKKGEVLELQVSPEGFGVATYSLKPGSEVYCKVDAATGMVTGLDFGDCTIQVAFDGDSNYDALDVTDLQTIAVGGKDSLFTWNPYREGVEYRVGVESMIGEVNVENTGATVSYEVVNAGDTGCAFKGTSGDGALTLSFDSHGICVVRATVSRSHYNDWSGDRILRVRPGAIAVSTGDFKDDDVLTVGEKILMAPTGTSAPVPSDAILFWELIRGERDCILMNPQTGAVRAEVVTIDPDNPPECSLQLVAYKEGYDLYRSEVVSIPLKRGIMGALTPPVYGAGDAHLPPRGHLDMTRVPEEVHGLVVTVNKFEVNGFQSDGTVPANDVCMVDSNGRITVGSGASVGNKCVVRTTMSAVGYEDKDVSLTLTVAKGELSFTPKPILSYTGDLKIGVGTPLFATGLVQEEDNSVSFVWDYRAEGWDAYGNSKLGVCNVKGAEDISPGSLTLGSSATVGDMCVVRALAMAPGYVAYATNRMELTVLAGDLVFAVDANTSKVDFEGRALRLGGYVYPAPLDSASDDNSVEVTWGNWRVEGYDSSMATKAGVCSVDSYGVVKSDFAAVEGDICKVYAKASAPGYNDSKEFEVGALTIEGKAALGTIVGPGYDEDLMLRGHPVSVRVQPSLSSSIDVPITWFYRGEGKRGGVVMADVCSVDEKTGTVTPGLTAEPGDTCEIYARAEASGYESEEAVTAVVLTLKEFMTSLNWPEFPMEATVGMDIDMSNDLPTSVPEGWGVSITVVSGACQYDRDNILSFFDTVECLVKAEMFRDGYRSISKMFRVTPEKGTIAVSDWGEYAIVKAGTRVSAPDMSFTYFDDATSAGVISTYKVADDSMGCTVDLLGVVTGTSVSNSCKVVRTLFAVGYHELEHTYDAIKVERGNQSLSWLYPYGGNPMVEVGETLSPKSPPIGGGSLQYRVKSGNTSYCSVGGDDGVVTGISVGSCVIQAQFAGDVNYFASGYRDIAMITVVRRSQTFPTWNNPYGVNPYVTVDSNLNIQSQIPVGGERVQYRIAEGSRTYCHVDSKTGQIFAYPAGVNQSCVVQAQLIGNDNYKPSEYVVIATVPIKAASLSAIAWGDFTGTLIVGGDTQRPTPTILAGADVVYSTEDSDCTLLDAIRRERFGQMKWILHSGSGRVH